MVKVDGKPFRVVNRNGGPLRRLRSLAGWWPGCSLDAASKSSSGAAAANLREALARTNHRICRTNRGRCIVGRVVVGRVGRVA
jgi:hypothetical protein